MIAELSEADFDSSLHLDLAELALRQGYTDAALVHAEESLATAQYGGQRLNIADALIMRGRIRLERRALDDAYRAPDDLDEGLRLAEQCGYVLARKAGFVARAECLRLLAAFEPVRR